MQAKDAAGDADVRGELLLIEWLHDEVVDAGRHCFEVVLFARTRGQQDDVGEIGALFAADLSAERKAIHPGIIQSEMTSGWRSSSHASHAAAPVSASRTVWPILRSDELSNRRVIPSSSAIRTFIGAGAGAAEASLQGACYVPRTDLTLRRIPHFR
jgi:hypothetical protein